MEPSQPPRRWPLGWLTFLGVFLLCTGCTTWLAVQGPGPPGYNVITGAGVPPGHGEFGFTAANVGQGVATGLPIGVIFGGMAAALVKVAQWGVRRDRQS
jgi:hypothetical protein